MSTVHRLSSPSDNVKAPLSVKAPSPTPNGARPPSYEDGGRLSQLADAASPLPYLQIVLPSFTNQSLPAETCASFAERSIQK